MLGEVVYPSPILAILEESCHLFRYSRGQLVEVLATHNTILIQNDSSPPFTKQGGYVIAYTNYFVFMFC